MNYYLLIIIASLMINLTLYSAILKIKLSIPYEYLHINSYNFINDRFNAVQWDYELKLLIPNEYKFIY